MMSIEEIESTLAKVLRPESVPLDPPSQRDWQQLEEKFGCTFGGEFRGFIHLMSKYQFPGEILNVSTGRTNGNDSIVIAYELEANQHGWAAEMIPFYAVGNGDYFCLSANECPASRVFYFFADRLVFEPYANSMEGWIRDLPTFLH